MSKIIHILNGQGTAFPFRQSGVPGEVVVWNEALAVGPVVPGIGLEAFWKVRANYHNTAYGTLEIESRPQFDYHDLVQSEFEKIEPLHRYQELVLWFEFDLFCQINLIALCSWLYRQDLGDLIISLVCIDRFPGIDPFKGMGQLAPTGFLSLFEQRQQLSKADLKLGTSVWLAYCDLDPRKIVDALKNNSDSSFPFLARAMQEHYKRFPNTINGLNKQEQQILNTVLSGSYSKRQLIGRLLQEDRWYGFGDTQYYLDLQRLGLLLSSQDQITVNQLGKEVLAGKKDFLEIQPEQIALGGALNTEYRWDSTVRQLVNQV